MLITSLVLLKNSYLNIDIEISRIISFSQNLLKLKYTEIFIYGNNGKLCSILNNS